MPTFICPTCQQATTVHRREEAPSRPFCSVRCKQVDLGRWLDGTYRISDPIKPGDLDELEQFDDEKA